MNKLILTDIDLTLLDFNNPFEDFLRSLGHDIAFGSLAGHCHLPNVYPYFTSDDTRELVESFFETDAFENLPAMPESVLHIQDLYRNGYEFIALSACPEWVGCDRRQTNLEKVFGIPFLNCYLTENECKGEWLQNYQPSVWVEDSVRHADRGVELGHDTYLIDHPHNRSLDTRAIRVNHWGEIKERLCSEN